MRAGVDAGGQVKSAAVRMPFNGVAHRVSEDRTVGCAFNGRLFDAGLVSAALAHSRNSLVTASAHVIPRRTTLSTNRGRES